MGIRLLSKGTERYTITIINRDDRQTNLTLYITPAIVGKPHYGGWINSYGHYYRVGMAEPIFIEDGLTDESKGVTLESLKELEKQYFLPKYKMVKVSVK